MANGNQRNTFRRVGQGFQTLRVCVQWCLLSVVFAFGVSAVADDSEQQPKRDNVPANNVPVSKVDRYYQYIDQLETEGAYDIRLSEPLFGLGRLLHEQQNYKEAAELFTRALHLTRINDGLYSASQIPILETLIDTQVKSQQWGSVDQHYAYMESLYRNLAKNNLQSMEAYMSGLEQASRWHLAAVNLDADEKNIEHLKRVREIHEKIIETAEQEYGASDIRLVPHLYRLALAHYYYGAGMLSREIASAVRFQPGGLFGDGNRTVSVNFQIARSVANGLEILNRIKSIYADAGDSEAQAMTVLYMADWALLLDDARRIESRMRYMLNSGGRSPFRYDVRSAKAFAAHQLTESAQQNYSLAYNMLLASGVPKENVEHYFGNLTILPTEKFNARLEDAAKAGPVAQIDHVVVGDDAIGGDKNEAGDNPAADTSVLAEYVSWSPYMAGVGFPGESVDTFLSDQPKKQGIAEFRVGANGRADGVRILESESEGLNTYAVRKEIESIQFRPRMAASKAVDSDVVQLRYVLNEQ